VIPLHIILLDLIPKTLNIVLLLTPIKVREIRIGLVSIFIPDPIAPLVDDGAKGCDDRST
jgi:hypothetical protein